MFLLCVFSSISWARCVFIQYHQDCWSCGSSPPAIIWLTSNISHLHLPYSWLGKKVIDFQISLGYQRQHCTILYAKWTFKHFLSLFNCSKISPRNDKHLETPPKWQIKSNQWINVVPAATAMNLKWIWKHQFKVNGHSRADNHFRGISDLEDTFWGPNIFCTRSQRVAALVSQIQIKVRRATLSLTLT